MFDGFIRHHARVSPRAPAVITPAGQVTYAAFDADIDRWGAALADRGLARSAAVVSVRMSNPYLTYVVLAALARLRVASSPAHDPGADIRLTDGAAETQGAGAGPRVIAFSADQIARVHAAQPTPLPILDLDPDALGRVMLSSGTTRTPRRVAFSWRRLQAISLANLCSRGAGVHGVWVPVTSVEAMQGLSMALAAWCQGAALVGGIRLADLPALMEAYPQGLIGCTPVQLRGLLGATPKDFTGRPGWRISVGGARLPVILAREARLRLTPDLRVTYGATEATLNTYGWAADLEEDPGHVGYPVGDTVLSVVDEAGRPVADGVSGEIRIRGDRVARGYLDDPEATAARFRDGWFHTRDIGRRMPDGRIVLEGRVDDRLSLENMKFMPSVLEDAALACPGVRDAAAFGAPREDGLDVCWLAVAVEPDFDRKTLAPHLARYPGLPPPRFAWVDEIPRNPTGKVERTRLRDALLAATRRT